VNHKNLDSLRLYGGFYNPLTEWSVLKMSGLDTLAFLNRQTTQELIGLESGNGRLTTRLDRTGKVQSFFFVYSIRDCIYLLVPSGLKESLIDDLSKFIIMDDVLIEAIDTPVKIGFGVAGKKQNADSAEFLFYGEWVRIAHQAILENEQVVDEGELELLRKLNGWPKWGADVSSQNFINDCRLNELAISYTKGCFLGQETVAKIQNNRGAASYPVLLEQKSLKHFAVKKGDRLENNDGKVGTVVELIEFESKKYIWADVKREWRVHNLNLNIGSEDYIVRYFPFFPEGDYKEKARDFYERGSLSFQRNDNESAKLYLEAAMFFDPENPDVYEALGVILGREERYEEAIELMDQLKRLDSASIMAHTNKSLYYMKLGRIEEAEKEKAEATLLSFEKSGREAELQQKQSDESKKQQAEIASRMSMFKEVLEIDPDDDVANFGMADIYFSRQEFHLAKDCLEKLLKSHPKHSRAHLLLGRTHEALGDKEQARELYLAGIKIATQKGELMPANEMQSRLSAL
jgi:folate-binding protein YgfZ